MTDGSASSAEPNPKAPDKNPDRPDFLTLIILAVGLIGAVKDNTWVMSFVLSSHWCDSSQPVVRHGNTKSAEDTRGAREDEVLSLMRDSDLAPSDYLKKFFFTGGERSTDV